MLVTPKPLPDELGRAYLGRMMHVNGVATEGRMVSLLAHELGITERQRMSLGPTGLLGLAAHLGIEGFVRRHTFIPLRRSIAERCPDLAHGALGETDILRLTGLTLMRPGVFLCPDCVRADLDGYGLSYWRREHQLPGTYWCARHRIPLRYLDERAALSHRPTNCLIQSAEVDPAWCEVLQRHQAIRRFLSILDGLMDSCRPFSARRVRDKLIARATSLGVHSLPVGLRTACRTTKLSDLVLEVFPAAWLAPMFPSLVAKRKNAFVVTIDSVLTRGETSGTVLGYALAMSVLYTSADDALLDLATANATTSEAVPHPDIGTLAQLSLVERLVIRQEPSLERIHAELEIFTCGRRMNGE